jgi:hypothetical protein
MELTESVIDILKIRQSWRIDHNMVVESDTLADLQQIVRSSQIGPLKGNSRFEFVDLEEADSSLRGILEQQEGLEGAQYCVVGIARAPAEEIVDLAMVDFGYLFEKIQIHAWQLGLATDWVRGRIRHKQIRDVFSLQANEQVLAIVPVGYPAKEHKHVEKYLQRVTWSNHRKPWRDLFFNTNFGTVLTEERAGVYAIPLEMVRWATSYQNAQPWRAVKEAVNEDLDFFVDQSDMAGPISYMAHIDAGIAMAHFEVAATELNLQGSWGVRNPKIDIPANVTYVASWFGS